MPIGTFQHSNPNLNQPPYSTMDLPNKIRRPKHLNVSIILHKVVSYMTHIQRTWVQLGEEIVLVSLRYGCWLLKFELVSDSSNSCVLRREDTP